MGALCLYDENYSSVSHVVATRRVNAAFMQTRREHWDNRRTKTRAQKAFHGGQLLLGHARKPSHTWGTPRSICAALANGQWHSGWCRVYLGSPTPDRTPAGTEAYQDTEQTPRTPALSKQTRSGFVTSARSRSYFMQRKVTYKGPSSAISGRPARPAAARPLSPGRSAGPPRAHRGPPAGRRPGSPALPAAPRPPPCRAASPHGDADQAPPPARAEGRSSPPPRATPAGQRCPRAGTAVANDHVFIETVLRHGVQMNTELKTAPAQGASQCKKKKKKKQMVFIFYKFRKRTFKWVISPRGRSIKTFINKSRE